MTEQTINGITIIDYPSVLYPGGYRRDELVILTAKLKALSTKYPCKVITPHSTEIK